MTLLWTLLTGNPVARAIAKIGGLILIVAAALRQFAFLTKKNALAKRDLADAKETIEAQEVRNEVENRIATERDAKEKLMKSWSE